MSEGTKICPYCGEEIKAIAIKCRYCGEFLNKDNLQSHNISSTTEDNTISSDISEQIQPHQSIIISTFCILLILGIIYYFFGKHYLDIQYDKATTINREKTSNISILNSNKTLGISYGDVMNSLSDKVYMKESTPVHGQVRYMGLSIDNAVLIEIIGNKDNITQTSIIISFENDELNRRFMLIRFLKNVVPEWDKDELEKTLNRNITERTNDKLVIGNKLIEFNDPMGGIIVTVKPN